MGELCCFSLPGCDEVFVLLWNKTAIRKFQAYHGVENVKIRIVEEGEMPGLFLKPLIKLFKRRRAKLGYFNPARGKLTLFCKNIISFSLEECGLKGRALDREEVEKLKKVILRNIAHVLSHELGHAKSRKDILGVSANIFPESQDEIFAGKFADRYAPTLESMFSVEEYETAYR